MKNYQHITDQKWQPANGLLGNTYCLVGKVVAGDKIGRQLGFPTANIELSAHYDTKRLPTGVYVAIVKIDQCLYQAMLNIGYRPSIKQSTHSLRVEAHIFQFEESIYGKTISLYLLKKLRAEKRFNHIEELIDQLKKDRDDSLSFFAEQEKE